MKKEFISILLIASLIYTPSTYAAEKQTEQVSEHVEFDNGFVWLVKGQVEKGCFKLCERSGQERRDTNETAIVQNGAIKVQISGGGILNIFDTTKRKPVIVRNLSGETIFDTTVQNQTDDISLEDEKTVVLKPGSKGILTSDTSYLEFWYDKNIILKSEKCRTYFLTVLHSVWRDSYPVSLATDKRTEKFRRFQDKDQVFLGEKPEEINLLNLFFSLRDDRQKKNQFCNKLSIIQCAVLAENLRAHGCIGKKNFGYLCKLLKSKVGVSLHRPIGYRENWSKKSCIWSSGAENILENVLGELIRLKDFKVLLECKIYNIFPENSVNFNLNRTMIIVKSENGKPVIVNIEDGAVLFEDDDITKLSFSDEGGEYIEVLYKNGTGKIVHLKNKEVLLKRDNVKLMRLSPDKTKATVVYQNDKGEVVNLAKDEEVVLSKDGVKWMKLYPSSEIIEIHYTAEGNQEVIKLKDEFTAEDKVLVEGSDIDLIKLNRASMTVEVYHQNDWTEIIDIKEDDYRLLDAGFETKRLDLNGKKMMVWFGNGVGEITNTENNMNIRRWNGVMNMYLDSSGTSVVVVSEDDDGSIRGEIVNLEDGITSFRWNNIENMSLSKDGTKVIGRYGEDKTEVKDVENGTIYFQGNDVSDAYFDETGNIVVIHYKNNKLEIINSENTCVSFIRDGVKEICLKAGRKAVIEYVDGRGGIVDLEYGTVLFEENDIARATLNLTGTRAVVEYKDNKLKIIDLEDCNRDMAFAKLGLKKLRFIFSLVNLNFSGTLANFIETNIFLWKSFDPDLQQKLSQHYFSPEARTAIQVVEEPLAVKVEDSAVGEKRKATKYESEIFNKKHKTDD